MDLPLFEPSYIFSCRWQSCLSWQHAAARLVQSLSPTAEMAKIRKKEKIREKSKSAKSTFDFPKSGVAVGVAPKSAFFAFPKFDLQYLLLGTA